MNVLSLFDGMSCGLIALDRLGIKVGTYYASEIDKYAMQVSKANYPEIIQVGDITKFDLSTLPQIDLVMGGSPCQGFSFAGKQLAFDDPRSALFFEFVRCVEELNPKYFLLENVRMKKEYLDIISEYMGVDPIFINSSLVSAQSRQRYYWTNIPNVEQPEERGMVLRDILEDQVGSEHYVGDNMQKNYKDGNQLNPNYKSQANTIHNSDKKSGTICAGTHGYANGYVGDKHKPVKQTERNARHLKQLDDKSLCMTASMYKGAGNNGMTLVPQHIGTAIDIKGHDQIKRVYSPDGKSPTVTTCGGGHREPKVVAGALRGRSLNEDGKNVKWKETKPKQMLETRKDEKSNAVSTFTKDNLVVQSYREVRTEEAKKARRENRQKTGKDHTPFRAKELQPRNDGKVGTVTPSLNNDHKISLTRDKDQEVYWRKLTPLECERLQTVPDNYTNYVSNTQRYKMLGNGWTIEVIAHILQNMEVDNV